MNIDKFGRHLMVGITHQTNTDKFGRHISSSDLSQQHTSSIGFLPLTGDGQYDVENKRLCNVHAPIKAEDGVNKTYVDESLETLRKSHIKSTPSLPSSIARDFFNLKVDVDKWQKEQSTIIDDLMQTISHIKRVVDRHENQLQGQSSLENRILLELDAVGNEIRKEHLQSKQQLEQLIKSYDISIQNLHKKVKHLEQQQTP